MSLREWGLANYFFEGFGRSISFYCFGCKEVLRGDVLSEVMSLIEFTGGLLVG